MIKEQYAHLCEDAKDNKEAIQRLYDVMKVLRVECPWDREQTHESLRSGMLEEAYETVDAINNNDMANLREELGDVMLQVVFHAILGEEKGSFDLKDIVNEECEKMIRRHPHVFLQETANNHIKSIDKVLEKWENIMVEERGEEGITPRLEKVPKALPALTRAFKVQKKAADVGFDWNDVSGAFDKVREETVELMDNYANDPSDKHALEDELGDLLFSVVNVSRFLGIDPEASLNYTISKFIRRFSYVEQGALACGRALENMTLEEMDELWNEAKKKERSML
ncbi:MAG: nucleoside triphosphate pyrophosphohydrolase [Firmicutes bacterium]|nr:nucleoside triphosphate pyrophosphohydrolase [Bacillota bacterium]